MNRQKIIAELFETMDVAKRSMHGHMQIVVQNHQISHTQLQLLFTIHLSQPTTAKQLAQKLQLTPGAISQMVDELVDQSLIIRQTDPEDRRRQVLHISDEGNELIKAFDKRRREVMNLVIKDLSDDELLAWLKIQHKIIDEFQNIHHKSENERK